MKPQTRTHFTLSLLTAGILCASTATWAANVPAGTQLADKQELVRNNGSEPASLDPHKVESDVEFNIISDLFDGLVSVSPAGEIQPRLAEKWENKDNTVWTFHLRPGITWSDGTPSPRKILSGAGSGWSTRKPPLRMPAIPVVCVSSTALISQKAKKRPSRWG